MLSLTFTQNKKQCIIDDIGDNMSRLTYIKILKEMFELFLKYDAEIDVSKERETEYREIISNLSKNHESFDENDITYHEVEFLCYIFENVPYYKVVHTLQKFQKNLGLLFEKSDKKHVLNFLRDILRELSTTINNRVQTELVEHITVMLRDFYFYEENGKINEEVKKQHFAILQRNLCNPQDLFSIEEAEKTYFEQQNLINSDANRLEKTKTRDAVSMSNYIKRKKVEDKMKEVLEKCYTVSTYNSFQLYVSSIYEEKRHEDTEFLMGDILIRYFFGHSDREIYKLLNEKEKLMQTEEQRYHNDVRLLFQIEDW